MSQHHITTLLVVVATNLVVLGAHPEVSQYLNWRKLAKTTHVMVLTSAAVVFWHSATVCQLSRLILMIGPRIMSCNQAQVVNLCTVFSALPVHAAPWQHTCSGRRCHVVRAGAGKSVLFFWRILEKIVKRVGLNAHGHSLALICRMVSTAVSLILVRE